MQQSGAPLNKNRAGVAPAPRPELHTPTLLQPRLLAPSTGAPPSTALDCRPPRRSLDIMCSGADGASWPLGKDGAPAALEHYRLQLYNYALAERLRLYPGGLPLYPAVPPYGPRLALSMSLLQPRVLPPDEPKPQHSYIGLIAMAILSVPDRKLVLSDIYQHILDNYPYFRSRGPGWRNSIRHNLSLNDCFVKAGRSANGKGHYWAIHPANVEDFRKGDFRRRKAQRKVRKHMGLAVDDDGEDSPSPPPASPPAVLPLPFWSGARPACPAGRKRQFDVASLLAPDERAPEKTPRRADSSEEEPEEDIDVVASDQEEAGPAWRSWPPLDAALLQRLRPHLAHLPPPHAHHPPDT